MTCSAGNVFGMDPEPRAPIEPPIDVIHIAPPAPKPEGWWLRTKNLASKPITFAKDNSELLNLAGALMHLPYIITADSSDAKTIKLAAGLAAASTSMKIMSVASGSGHAMKILAWDMPKMLCYLLGTGYDALRIMDAPKVAYKNQTDPNKLRGFKISQSLQLSIEIVLRIMSILSEQDEHSTKAYVVSGCASQLADIVSIWRLLNRYVTYLPDVDTLEFGFTVRKNPGATPQQKESEDNDEQEIEKLEELAELAEKLAAQQNQMIVNSEAAEGAAVHESA